MYVAFCFGKKLTILKATNPTFVGFVCFFFCLVTVRFWSPSRNNLVSPALSHPPGQSFDWCIHA